MSALTSSMASLHLSALAPAMVTLPSSSTLISHSVSSMIFLMFLPPGPINAPIFSGLIVIEKIRGAYSDISLASGNASFIKFRMCKRPSRACSNACSINSKEIPSILRSNCIALIPSAVPAILKSISPR